jgi:hypothetical protein
MPKLEILKYGNCARLYDEDGKHVLSILPCPDCPEGGDGKSEYAYAVDVATPDGKVVWCDVPLLENKQGEIESTHLRDNGVDDFHTDLTGVLVRYLPVRPADRR